MRWQTQSTDVTSPAPRNVWQEIVNSNPTVQLFQTPLWTDCMARIDGYEDASRLFETSGGCQMVLPMGRRRSFLGLVSQEASMPRGWEFGGLVSKETIRSDDVETVVTNLNQRGLLTSATVHPNPVLSPMWEAAKSPRGIIRVAHLTHVLDLEGGFDRVWDGRMTSRTRRNIRKAERTGLTIESDTTGRLIPAYYELYEQWMTRRAQERRLPVGFVKWVGRNRDSRRKLQTLAEMLGDSLVVWIASHHGERVAAAIQLLHGIHAHYWRGVSDLAATRATKANDLLQRAMIEHACESGCRYYHMGESGNVMSLAYFKARYGAVPHVSYKYILERVPIARTRDTAQALLLQAGDWWGHWRGKRP